MSHALLVLGGGAFVAPVLRWAREAGLEAVLVDADPKTPLRRLAAQFHPIPDDDAEALTALTRRLVKSGSLVGIHAADPRALARLAALAEAAPQLLPPRDVLQRMLVPADLRAHLAQRGIALAEREPGAERELDVFAFFRDGAFVPAGIALRRTHANGDISSVQPSGLAAALELAIYVQVERAARALGFERGPLQATLSHGGQAGSSPTLVALHPGYRDALGASHVARLARARSPLQAWFAHLAGAGGPFDEVALEPRAAAGWLALAPERAGRFGGIDGVTRARAVPGVVDLWIEEPGRELGSPEVETRPLAYVWAEAHDPEELEERLRAARAALEVRVACRQRVA